MKSYPNAHLAQGAEILTRGRTRRSRQVSSSPNIELVKHFDRRDGLHPVKWQGIYPEAEAAENQTSPMFVQTPQRRHVLAGDWDRAKGARKLRGWDGVVAGFDPFTPKRIMAGRRTN